MTQQSQPVDQYDASSAQALTFVRTMGGRLISQQVDLRAGEVGRRVSETALALREAGDDIRRSGRAPWMGDAFEYAAAYVGRLGSYLTSSTSDTLAHDFERYAQERPVATAAAALVSGFTLARVLRVAALPRTGRYNGSASSAQAGS